MSTMQQLERPYTADDLEAMPDDGRTYEIIGGELIVSPSPGIDHQWISDELTARLRAFVRERRLGVAISAPLDVHLGAHDVVQPDIVFVGTDRLGIVVDRVIKGTPELLVEIHSPSSRGIDRIKKSALYATAGVREYWIVDPDQESVQVQENRDGRFFPIDQPAEGRIRSNVLDGFEVAFAELFEMPEELKGRI